MLELWAKNVCPHCGNPIPEGKRVGAGDRGKGGFCSLVCYGRYHELELRQRARKVAALAEQHRKPKKPLE